MILGASSRFSGTCRASRYCESLTCSRATDRHGPGSLPVRNACPADRAHLIAKPRAPKPRAPKLRAPKLRTPSATRPRLPRARPSKAPAENCSFSSRSPAIEPAAICQSFASSSTLRQLLELPLCRAGIELAGSADLLGRILDHLVPLRHPADGARHGEQHGEHRDGNAHRPEDDT